MGALPNPESLGLFYASSIEELRDVFDRYHLHHGSAKDIPTVTRMLRQPGPFYQDLSQTIRTILNREGNTLSRARMLDILVLAIGGPGMEHPPSELSPQFTQLFDYLTSVRIQLTATLPGQQGKVVPFPTPALPERPADASVQLSYLQPGVPPISESAEVPASKLVVFIYIVGIALVVLALALAFLLRPQGSAQAPFPQVHTHTSGSLYTPPKPSPYIFGDTSLPRHKRPTAAPQSSLDAETATPPSPAADAATPPDPNASH